MLFLQMMKYIISFSDNNALVKDNVTIVCAHRQFPDLCTF